jgi:cytochrome c biogenesis protein CcdA
VASSERATAYPRSMLLGAMFAAAWSPCIGPILGAVLALAAASGTAFRGGLLLVAYSLGLGVWFLILGLGFGWLSPRLRHVYRYLPVLMAVSGALFILVGAAMFLGEFGRLNRQFQSMGFLLGTTDAESQLATLTGGVLGPVVAVAGGMVSILSPCVLPLFPVYLANLAGEAAIASGEGRASRAHVLRHSLAFIAGFTVVFAALGASAGLLGGALTEHLDLVTRAGGLLMVAFGLQMSGLIHFPFLDRTYQLPAAPSTRPRATP